MIQKRWTREVVIGQGRFVVSGLMDGTGSIELVLSNGSITVRYEVPVEEWSEFEFITALREATPEMPE